MTVKEKQGFGLYFLFAFGMAWLCQIGGCMALLQQNNAVLYQLALIVTMFCPLLAVLLVQKAFKSFSKKCLTKNHFCGKIIKSSAAKAEAHRTLKIEQYRKNL